ncbi:hypothetical protein LR066_05735 [candidate division WOR-3 bacterium]|nr:hypothetical protein [candidate division WOR-3 bacterium]
MKNKKCVNCSEDKRCKESYISWIFFIIGLLATTAMRVVTVLADFNPVYGKIAWYVGVGGFFAFFIYRFRVTQARSNLINQRSLAYKIRHKEQLTKEDYSLIRDILCSISSNKERINYFFIFALSAVALILAIYLDFVK